MRGRTKRPRLATGPAVSAFFLAGDDAFQLLDWHQMIVGTPLPARSRGPIALDVTIFAVVALAILTCIWPSIRVQNIEIGDFAANSLLIQDAKHLALFKGNYSRIGVNHPGPAILYVLAFGEWLFYDVLHLTQSPFSGQLIAVCLYTAFWTTIICRESRKLWGSIRNSLVLPCVFLALLAFVDFNFFAGIWFPDLYVFPFAAMIMAMARLANGRADSLRTLAISSGFLINGHVSFVSTMALIFMIMLVGNTVWYRTNPEARIIRITFFRRHAGEIGRALLLLALFFVPLAIETYRSYPGPVAAYLKFGSQQSAHPLRESWLFVAAYWGGVTPLLGALAAMILAIVTVRDKSAIRSGFMSLILVFAAATIALLVYAMFGIDYLNLVYLGYFYYTVPALLFAVVATVAFIQMNASQRLWREVVFCGACLVLAYWTVHRPAVDLNQYNQPNVVALNDAIAGVARDGRVVLDLDDRREWGYLWTTLVGAEAFGRRQNQNLFCIDKHWHILFTEAAHCTIAELKERPRYIVDVLPSVRKNPPTFSAAGLDFYRYEMPDITDRGDLPVGANTNLYDDYFLGSGWSSPEGDYVWSYGSESHLNFRKKPGLAGDIVLDCGAFLVPGHQEVTGHVFINGREEGAFRFVPEQGRQMLSYRLPVEAETIDMKIVVDNPTSPLAVGAGNDPRILGISLFAMRLKPT